MFKQQISGVLKTLGLSVLWTKTPKTTTLVECRTFAKEQKLKLPKGVPQSREAFVVLFMLCHMTPFGFVSLKKVALTQEHLNSLFAYRDERDRERHNKKKSVFVKRKKNAQPVAVLLTPKPRMCLAKQLVSRLPNSPKQQAIGHVRPNWPAGFTPEGQPVLAPQFGFRFCRT